MKPDLRHFLRPDVSQCWGSQSQSAMSLGPNWFVQVVFFRYSSSGTGLIWEETEQDASESRHGACLAETLVN